MNADARDDAYYYRSSKALLDIVVWAYREARSDDSDVLPDPAVFNEWIGANSEHGALNGLKFVDGDAPCYELRGHRVMVNS